MEKLKDRIMKYEREDRLLMNIIAEMELILDIYFPEKGVASQSAEIITREDVNALQRNKVGCLGSILNSLINTIYLEKEHLIKEAPFLAHRLDECERVNGYLRDIKDAAREEEKIITEA